MGFALSMCAALAAAPPAGFDGPYVEIVRSQGMLDGPNVGTLAAPRWDTVRLELEVENRLPVEAGDLTLRIELVRGSSNPQPIPGWSFDVRLEDVWIPGLKVQRILVERPLPDRREALTAEEVRHRVVLVGYRFAPAQLNLGLRLLESVEASDQRAALQSFDAERLSIGEVVRATRQLGATLRRLPRTAGARDVLRLLYALRALGRLKASEQIMTVLAIEDRLPPRVWGPAVVDLASRMVEASSSGAPRLEVLPRWARDRSGLLRVRAQDAVPEAVRDAVIEMGDAAVPGLVVALHRSESEAIRERAWRLLVSMGRATVRSQLRLEPGARAQMIEAFGALALPDAADALVELLPGGGRFGRAAAGALVEIGPEAVPALKAALGRPDGEAARNVLVTLLERSPEPSARALGLDSVPTDPADAVDRLAEQARAERSAQLSERIERALALPFADARRDLDQVYREDSQLYYRHEERIARLYLEGARRLAQAGNHDEALRAAREGLTVQDLPELREVGATALLDLADGWGDLKRWDDMEAALTSRLLDPPPYRLQERLRQARNRLASGRAAQALRLGERARARSIVDKALALDPSASRLRSLDRRLLILENLPIVVAVGLGGAMVLLAAVLWILRRFQRQRMARLEAILDARGRA